MLVNSISSKRIVCLHAWCKTAKQIWYKLYLNSFCISLRSWCMRQRGFSTRLLNKNIIICIASWCCLLLILKTGHDSICTSHFYFIVHGHDITQKQDIGSIVCQSKPRSYISYASHHIISRLILEWTFEEPYLIESFWHFVRLQNSKASIFDERIEKLLIFYDQFCFFLSFHYWISTLCCTLFRERIFHGINDFSE